MSYPIIILSGPTASGKTALALALAQRLKGEIISADSRQLYRKMDIGTAKPTTAELALVLHHCIDIREPDESFSAGEFGKLTQQIIRDKPEIPLIICGGSGMYIQAALGMIFDESTTNEQVRLEIRAEGDAVGWDEMYRRLQLKDSDYAAAISRNDIKRISRAWEIIRMTGEPPTAHFARQNRQHAFEYVHYSLNPERNKLWQRIEARTRRMITGGLIDEASMLLNAGYDPDLNALNSVGYTETFAYLRGELTQDQLVEQISIHTRQFAKRQSTWFRRYAPHHWLNYDDELPVERFVEFML